MHVRALVVTLALALALAAGSALAAAPGPSAPASTGPSAPPVAPASTILVTPVSMPPAPATTPPNGELVAVAVGGTCTFSVNGVAKGTSSQLKLSVPAGVYTVTCKPASGATTSRSVIVKSGEPAMAMFKLN